MNSLLALATVVLDPPTALLFGAVLALASSRLIRRAPATELKRTALVGAGWGGLYGLSVGWFYFARPDWMLVYLKDSREVPLLPGYVVFVLVLVVHGAAGALAGGGLVAAGRDGLAWLLAIGALATVALFFWLQSRQYVELGTYEQFHAGTAPPLTADGVMQLAMNISGAVSGVSAGALLLMRFRQGRRPSEVAKA